MIRARPAILPGPALTRARWALAVALLVLAVLASDRPVEAHRGAGPGPVQASTWARQALALLAAQPPDLREAAERLEGALRAPEAQGVDLALVREALSAVKAGNAEAAADALGRALAPSSPPRGEEAGAVTSRRVEALAPLEPCFAGTPGEYALLGIGGAFMALGLWAALRIQR